MSSPNLQDVLRLGNGGVDRGNILEVVERFDHIARGRGGYWEDRGYEWYAGI